MEVRHYPACIAIIILAFLSISTISARALGPGVPNGFFFEGPYSMTGIRSSFEVIVLDDPPDGVLLQNFNRIDLDLFNNFIGVYGKFPFAGVVDFGPDDEDEYDFGNIGVGAKLALLNTDGLILTGGFEVILPSAEEGAGGGAAQAYFREFPYFLEDALTLVPYGVVSIGGDVWALQGNFNAEIITDADEIEGDDSELRLKYGATASLTPSLGLPFRTSVLLEALFVSTTSFEDDVTEVFLTPGLRLGGRLVSLGTGVQIPLGEDVDDFANVNFFVDLIITFGG